MDPEIRGFSIAFYSWSLGLSRQLHAECHDQSFALCVFYTLQSTPASILHFELHSSAFLTGPISVRNEPAGSISIEKSFSSTWLDKLNSLLLLLFLTRVSLLCGLLPLFMRFRRHLKAVHMHPAPRENKCELSKATCRTLYHGSYIYFFTFISIYPWIIAISIFILFTNQVVLEYCQYLPTSLAASILLSWFSALQVMSLWQGL